MKQYVKYLIPLVLVLGLVFSFIYISNLRERANNAEHNLAVQRDSTHYVQLKNGELLAERESYILKQNELQEYLDISKCEVKDLQKKLGSSLKEIATLKGKVKIDTVKTTVIKDSIIYRPDSLIFAKFKHDEKWLQLSGDFKMTPENTDVTLYNINIPVDVKAGWTKDDKFFITSPNPYVKFGDIQAATITKPKTSKWHVGLQAGMYVIYDTPRKRIATGPGVGLGIMRDF